MSIVTLENERTVHFHDHEVLLSFINDEDAVYFYEWWDNYGGEELFLEYLKEKQNES